MKNHADNDELKDTSLLKGIPKHDPFVVPIGFFDQFPRQVQQRIISRNEQNVLSVWLQHLRKPAILGAASVVLVALMAIWIWRPPKPTTEIAQQAISPATELIAMEDFNETELYTLFARSENTMSEVDLPLDDDALINYLENEDLSLDFLTEEL